MYSFGNLENGFVQNRINIYQIHHDMQTLFSARIFKWKSFVFVIMSSCLLFPTGCATYKITTSQADKADVQPKTAVLTSYFWGGWNKPKIGVVDTTCGTAGLESVKFKTNAGYALLQIFTLGIVHKIKVEYMCQKEGVDIGFNP
jgi:hypothetical protein